MTNIQSAGPLPKLKAGDTLLRIPDSRRIGREPAMSTHTVDKVGRRWGYTTAGRRFSLDNGDEDAGNFNSYARYMTQEMYDNQARRAEVLGKLQAHGIAWGFGRGAARFTTDTLEKVLAVLVDAGTDGLGQP